MLFDMNICFEICFRLESLFINFEIESMPCFKDNNSIKLRNVLVIEQLYYATS